MIMNTKSSIIALVLAGSLALLSTAVTAQEHGHESPVPPTQKWSFSGPFGKFDQGQLQRGFKIYREVCSSCHSMSLGLVPQSGGRGWSRLLRGAGRRTCGRVQDQVISTTRAKPIERAGRPADAFPSPFANDRAAAAANGVAPPDFSTLAKARTYERGFPWFVFDIFTQFQEQGPDYITALLQGYKEAPSGFTVPPGGHYNEYFPGHVIAMPQPLTDGQVTFDDGAPQTLAQYAKDVTAFMMWAAEPHLVQRKRIGFQVMIFLIVFAGLLYFTKKKVWSAVH